MPTLDQKLELYYTRVSNLKQLTDRLTYVRNTLEGQKKKLAELKVNLRKEEQDVEELEKLSWQSLFHRVLGNKKEQLEKERQEYLRNGAKITLHFNLLFFPFSSLRR